MGLSNSLLETLPKKKQANKKHQFLNLAKGLHRVVVKVNGIICLKSI